MKNRYQHLFDTGMLRKDLKQRSVRGGLNAFFSQSIVYVMRIGFSAVLARLLAPQDYGLVAMVSALTALADQFRDMGLSQATIQQRDIKHEQVSALFWINVGIGALLTLVVAASAPLVARFYNEPRLTLITITSSLSFTLGGLNVQHQALLQRQMMYGRLAAVNVASVAGSSLIAVLCAFAGMNYWALVCMNLSHPAIRGLGLWLSTGWRPGLFLRRSGTRSMLRFGAGVSGFNVVNYFSRNLDNILIGKINGTQALGYYSKAYQLLLLPILQIRTPLLNVGIPALSALQDEPERYRRYYRGVVGLLAFLSMPLIAWMIVCAEEIVRIFLGPRWMPSVPLFAVLGLVSLVQAPITAIRGLPLLSLGRGRKYFQFGLITAIVTSVSFLVGIRWGTMGLAWSYVISTYALIPLTTPWCLRGSPVSWRDALKAIMPGASAAVAVGVAAGVIRRYFHTMRGDAEITLATATQILLATATAAGFILFIWVLVQPTIRRGLVDQIRRWAAPNAVGGEK